ncbi:MAG: PAS domain-containing protein [Cyclobacteriaceae bacterium]
MDPKSSSFRHTAGSKDQKDQLEQKILRLRKELAEAEMQWDTLNKHAEKPIRNKFSDILLVSQTPTQPVSSVEVGPRRTDTHWADLRWADPLRTDSRWADSHWSLLQAAVEHHQHFMVIVDRHLRCIAISKKARLESRMMLGKMVRRGIDIAATLENHEADLPPMRQWWDKALKGEEIQREISLQGVSGLQKHYKLYYYPVEDMRGNIIGAALGGYDITELKKEQHQQRLSENKFRGIIEGAEDAVAAVDTNMCLIEINQKAQQLLELTLGIFLQTGQSLAGLSVRHELLDHLRKALNGEEFTTLHKVQPFATSAKAYYEISFSGIRDEHTRLIGVTMIARDVSRERRIEQKLKDIKEFRFLAENMAQLIWTTRPNGEPEYYNSRFHHYTGITLDTLRLRQWRSIIHPDDLHKALGIWQHALRLGTPCEMEYRIKRHSDQSYRWHLVRSIPMKDQQGNITRWVGTATDIHEIKQQKEEIEEKNQQLQRINQYLDDFVHATAHDMRVPVTRLQLLIETFKEMSDSEREHLLPKIVRSVNHLDSALRGLIQVIDLEGHVDVVDHKILLKEAIENILQRYADDFRTKEVKVNIHESQVCEVRYIRAYLNTIVSNIVSNALKYRAPGRPLQLDIHIEKSQGYCMLTFKDNGIGINLEKYGNKLFQPFRRIHQKKEGLGLGLYVIQTMVQKNGGRVEVESKPGEGAIFRIYLKEYQ